MLDLAYKGPNSLGAVHFRSCLLPQARAAARISPVSPWGREGAAGRAVFRTGEQRVENRLPLFFLNLHPFSSYKDILD